jgi:signal transduction histidine kinase
MPETVWYRSLYWRIAIGFVALLAALLVVQGGLFVWMTNRTDLFPSRSPAQLASTIASDLSAALGERPDLDLETYIMSRHGRAIRGFVVVTLDGRTVVSRRIPPPADLASNARARLFGREVTRTGPPAGPRRGDGPGRGGRGFPAEYARITAAGATFGMVAVPAGAPPLALVLRDLGPTLALVAIALLAAGTVVAALAVFRPAHRRLRALQQAAAAIGAGQLDARAPQSGRDEVASLAHQFNDMAARLEERTREVQVADRTRRQLLADVSHELSTPLAAIRGYVETLQMRDLALDVETERRYLGIIHEEAERLEHIIGDLLDLARLEAGGGAFKNEEVSVAQLFGRLHARHGRTLEERGVTLETSGADVVPHLRGDANRLEQALQNLVANAIPQTPEGGRIRVWAERAEDAVRLIVEDTGPGIAPEHLPHVFDRFYKADSSRAGTSVPSGSGLGLSIVQAIAVRHGGAVTAANAPGGGARFEVVLRGSEVFSTGGD